MSRTKLTTRGFGLLEVVIGAAIVSLVLAAVIGTFASYVRSGALAENRIKAVALAEEGLEAMRSLRNAGFAANIASLSTGTTYRVVFSGGAWSITSANTFIDETFDRSVVLSSVYRRTSDSDIVPAASSDTKALDTDAREAIVTVSWRDGSATSTVSLATYLTNLYDN